jgi:hypothetical protein
MAEVLKKISPLPDGREHRLTSSKRGSAKSETFASRRNKLAKKQIAVQSKKKQLGNKEKGCEKKRLLEGKTVTEAEDTTCHFCKVIR